MADSVADNMHGFIDRWRVIAITELAHAQRKVAGHPVAWWFDLANATTADFMKALAGDAALVSPGDPSASPFFTNFLKLTRPMGNRLAVRYERVPLSVVTRRWHRLCLQARFARVIPLRGPPYRAPNSHSLHGR